MTTTTRILTVAGLLGALGLAGAAYLHGQSQRADAATTVVATEEAAPVLASDAIPAMHFRHHGDKPDEAAKLFGITTDDLRKELQSGKPFYQIAAEHGVTYDKLREQRKVDLKTRLDDMVKVGFMTQAQADEILNKADEAPMLGFGHHGGFGMMRMTE